MVKFNPNLEWPKSKVQDNPTFGIMQPMINLDLDKGKQSLDFSTTKVTPKRIHHDSSIDILQGTFEHINITPLYDAPPSNNVNQPSSKYPKRTLKIYLNQIMQQQEKV